LQLCAQALCLEEMTGRSVRQGAVYSIKTKRRRVVEFTEALREEAVLTTEQIRALQTAPWHEPLPQAVNDKRCPKCSLLDACVPATVIAAREVRLRRELFVPLTVA
ncbi:MAG: Dna2/Cas4 domain-containing protein, partial [Alphaproteobacteria bacterium]